MMQEDFDKLVQSFTGICGFERFNNSKMSIMLNEGKLFVLRNGKGTPLLDFYVPIFVNKWFAILRSEDREIFFIGETREDPTLGTWGYWDGVNLQKLLIMIYVVVNSLNYRKETGDDYQPYIDAFQLLTGINDTPPDLGVHIINVYTHIARLPYVTEELAYESLNKIRQIIFGEEA